MPCRTPRTVKSESSMGVEGTCTVLYPNMVRRRPRRRRLGCGGVTALDLIPDINLLRYGITPNCNSQMFSPLHKSRTLLLFRRTVVAGARGTICKPTVSSPPLLSSSSSSSSPPPLRGSELGVRRIATSQWMFARARSSKTYSGGAQKGAPLPEEHEGVSPQSVQGGNGGRNGAETEAEFESPGPKDPEPGRPVILFFLSLALPVFILSNVYLLTPFLISARDLESTTIITSSSSPTGEQLNAYIRAHRPDLLRLQHVSQATWVNTTLTPIRFFPQSADAKPWHTLVTYAFNHGGMLHFFFCYMGFKAFVPSLSFAYGDRRTAATFLLGSTMAGAAMTVWERWLNPWSKVSGQDLSAALHHHRFPATAMTTMDEDGREHLERKLKDAVSANLGSSGGIITLGTIAAIVCPGMELNLMFIPYGFRIRTLMVALAAFDFGGAFVWDYGLGIGHKAHLAGYVSGILLYTLWLRRVPFAFRPRVR
ncbi:hypothetical protein C7212DRAFT_367122 [Tuber magnatum]|uniref:Uncharacterized protein n=1 Tax=Tuber magnatum TaxID=42249 RepID=A0A317SDT1_9PEZI|nr:hypothetical protein C7212DRAFT_367122 [Tuber magnatum]